MLKLRIDEITDANFSPKPSEPGRSLSQMRANVSRLRGY